MTLTLAFDTSADACAVALVRDGATLGRAMRPMSRGHAEALIPMVQQVMASAGLSLGALDLVGVTVGPGSFTGVRTGIAAARGLALGAAARAVGVSSLAAVAAAALDDAPAGATAVCVLETRRLDFFVQVFGAGPAQGTAAATAPAVLDAAATGALVDTLIGDARGAGRPGGLVLAGNAVDRLAAALGVLPPGVTRAPGDGLPDAAIVARLAAATADAAAGSEKMLEDTLGALYLRPPEAKLPQKGGRLRK